jgi:hypothetical protein
MTVSPESDLKLMAKIGAGFFPKLRIHGDPFALG